MKKVICLFLCLILVISMLAVFTACEGDEDPNDEDPNDEINPDDPDTDPDNPDTDPDNPDTDPDNPDTDPDNPDGTPEAPDFSGGEESNDENVLPIQPFN